MTALRASRLLSAAAAVTLAASWSVACSPAGRPSSHQKDESPAGLDGDAVPHTVDARAPIPASPAPSTLEPSAREDSAAAVPVPDGGAPAGTASLAPEERERDPRSAEVTIHLVVEPPNRAHVFWGVKDLGPAPLELRRPRGSGPLDLVLRAPGYLTFHTRAFTDRDDRLSIRMVPVTEAASVFGFRPDARAR